MSKFGELVRDVSGNITDAGKAMAHARFPNEFEYYMVGIEITRGEEITDRFFFPVMPNSIDIREQKITSIKKTSAGIVVYTNDSFIPKKITINGSFGRRVRVSLLGNVYEDAFSFNYEYGDNKKKFSPTAKTGYGYTKILNALYNKSTTQKDGVPYLVKFYNMAYNSSYYVELESLSIQQNLESNMIWNYELTMTAIAPVVASEFGEIEEKLRFSSANVINKLANDLATNIKNVTKWI
jgi:hypothetical protein